MKGPVFGLLILGSVAMAATPQDEVQSLTRLVDPHPLTIESVTPTCSFHPGVVWITGENLDLVVNATVAGQPAKIRTQSIDTLTLVPVAADPGFDEVVLNSAISTARAEIELLPTLQARIVAPQPAVLNVPGALGLGQTTGGDLIEVRLHDTENTFFVLAASAGDSNRPMSFEDPLAYYQLMLDPGYVILDWGFLMRPEYGTTRWYEIPYGLKGRVSLQGLCAELGSSTSCYTNLTQVVIP